MTTNVSLHASNLVEAFERAWLLALEAEAIDAANMAYAPAELLKAVILAASEGYVNSDALGKAAFTTWSAQSDEGERAGVCVVN